MFTIIWEYQIEPAMQTAFEEYYHADGIWAHCFRQHTGFIATQLLQDQDNPYHYLTIDYWQHETSFQQFYQQHRDDYDAIDKLCGSFTISEHRVGTFTVPALAGIAMRADRRSE